MDEQNTISSQNNTSQQSAIPLMSDSPSFPLP